MKTYVHRVVPHIMHSNGSRARVVMWIAGHVLKLIQKRLIEIKINIKMLTSAITALIQWTSPCVGFWPCTPPGTGIISRFVELGDEMERSGLTPSTFLVFSSPAAPSALRDLAAELWFVSDSLDQGKLEPSFCETKRKCATISFLCRLKIC